MTHVALLRGINVGGKNILPMKDLAKMFARRGMHERAHLHPKRQRDFRGAGRRAKIADTGRRPRSKSSFGYRVPVVLRTARAIAQDHPRQSISSRGRRTRGGSTSTFSPIAPKAGAIAGLDPAPFRARCFSRAWTRNLSASSQRHGAHQIDQRVLRFEALHHLHREKLGDGAQAFRDGREAC